jgi:hypothetical protein
MAVLDSASADDMERRRRESREAMREYLEIKDRFASSDPNVKPSGVAYDRLRERLLELPQKYADALPVFVLGRCPVCSQPLRGPFDPWGFDGFWWVPKLRGKVAAPTGCEHFRVLLGAVSLRGQPVIAGPYEAQLGPDTPYVVPRLLELPTMVAAVHSVPMEPGYLAFPIAYFSRQIPPIGSLTQGWIETRYSYEDANGRHVWTIRNDRWDFDLAPWIANGRVKWTMPDNAEALIAPSKGDFPYANPSAVCLPQVAESNRVRTLALPNQEELAEPFE